MPGKPRRDGLRLNEEEREQAQRFISALRQAMIVNNLSERGLAAELHITAGSTQRYFRMEILPMRVSTEVNYHLARLLGITLSSLVSYYTTGEYEDQVTFEEVARWIDSTAAKEHVSPLLEAMRKMSERCLACAKEEVKTEAEYTWPIEELKACGVSESLQAKMGLTKEKLNALATTGKFDEEMVEAFSVAVNIEKEQVRQAFSKKLAVPPGLEERPA